MISKGRKYDMDIRAVHLGTMETCLRLYKKTGEKKFLDDAKFFGEASEKLKTRIASHDYSEEDEQYRVVEEMDRKWQKKYE